MRKLSDLVLELLELNDENLSKRVIQNNDVQWCLSELCDILEYEELRPKGRWIKTSESKWDANEGDFFIEEFYSCSICKEDEERKSPYCPNCGAKMENT